MYPMNRKYNQAIVELVSAYENMSEQGTVAYFEEKTFHKLIAFYKEDDQPERALEVVEHALTHHSFSADFYIKKAELLIDLQEEVKALRVLEHAAVFAPAEKEIDLLRAEALIYLGRSMEALAILENIKDYADSKTLSNVYTTEALVYESQEEYERMFYALKAALQENPANKEALERLWLCVELSKKYEASVELHDQILNADPYSHIAWYNLGHAHAYLGNYDEAIEAFEFAFVIDEQFECAYRDCAELCFELKMHKKALKFYLELLENFEPDSELFLRIGQCYLFSEDYPNAQNYFRRAIYLDPLNDEVYFHIGLCNVKEEKWITAITYFQKAINIEDQQEEYYFALAEAFNECGDDQQAEPNYQMATEIAPENAKYWVHYARFLMDQGAFEEGLDLLERAEDYAVGMELTYCKIACLFSMGRRNEGFYWLGEALSEDFAAHASLFEFLPELENDSAVLSMIDIYTM